METSEKSDIVQEGNVKINIRNVEPCLNKPQRNSVVYNPNMSLSRSIGYLALASAIDTTQYEKFKCLDAIGATGIAGISWAKDFKKADVVVNDPSSDACKKIIESQELNEVEIEITQENVNVILCQRSFNFIYLDCYGSSVHYLSSIFKNLWRDAILVITSTDEAALYGKAPNKTFRNYSGFIRKTFYYKELASRLIIAAAAREAAKYSKGIKVLCCVAVKSHVTVVLRVTRGPTVANECVNMIRKVIHCCICEDRAFYPETWHPVENPYSLLTCSCRKKYVKIGVDLGPVWSGEIFNTSFCKQMYTHAEASNLPSKSKLISLLKTIIAESDPILYKELPEKAEVQVTDHSEFCRKRLKVEDIPENKKDVKNIYPAFYFNIHKHSPKGHDLKKLDNLVDHIRNNGYRASRTHFDPEAIRTEATLNIFNTLVKEFHEYD